MIQLCGQAIVWWQHPIKQTGNDENVIKQWSFGWLYDEQYYNNDDDNNGEKNILATAECRFISKKTHESLWHLLHFISILFHTKRWFYSSKILVENTHTSYSFQNKKGNRKSVGSGFVCFFFFFFFFCAFVFLIAPQNRKNIVIELCVILMCVWLCFCNRCLMPIKKIPTNHPKNQWLKLPKYKCTNWLRFKRYGDPFKCYCCVEKRHIHTHTHAHTKKEIWYLQNGRGWKRGNTTKKE